MGERIKRIGKEVKSGKGKNDEWGGLGGGGWAGRKGCLTIPCYQMMSNSD